MKKINKMSPALGKMSLALMCIFLAQIAHSQGHRDRNARIIYQGCFTHFTALLPVYRALPRFTTLYLA